MRIKAPMRKQGDNPPSTPNRPTVSPGSRLGASIKALRRGYHAASRYAPSTTSASGRDQWIVSGFA
jgi:hypothetical protein